MKLGIAVDGLNTSQLSFYILKQLYDKSLDDDIIIFYNKIQRPCIPLNATSFHISEMWDYNGHMIATDLNLVSKLIQCPGAISKYFYIWDLEWKDNVFSYEYLSNIYDNTRLSLITRSTEHQWLVKNSFNRDSVICDNFNLSQLIEIIKNDHQS